MRDADIFVFPSFREAGGNVAFEAMGWGLPLIVSDIGGPGAAVDDSCGIRIHPERPEQYASDIAEAIVRLTRDPVLRRRLGDAARSRVTDVGLWDSKIDRIDALYRDLVDGPTGRGRRGRRRRDVQRPRRWSVSCSSPFPPRSAVCTPTSWWSTTARRTRRARWWPPGTTAASCGARTPAMPRGSIAGWSTRERPTRSSCSTRTFGSRPGRSSEWRLSCPDRESASSRRRSGIRTEDSLAPSAGNQPCSVRSGSRATGLPALSEYVGHDSDYLVGRCVDWALGAVLLVSSECHGALGGWDESFFLYSEETDFASRARALGYATWYEPAALAVHIGAQSGTDDRIHSMQILNRVRYYSRRHEPLHACAYYALAVGNELSRLPKGSRHHHAVRTLVRPSTRTRGAAMRQDTGTQLKEPSTCGEPDEPSLVVRSRPDFDPGVVAVSTGAGPFLGVHSSYGRFDAWQQGFLDPLESDRVVSLSLLRRRHDVDVDDDDVRGQDSPTGGGLDGVAPPFAATHMARERVRAASDHRLARFPAPLCASGRGQRVHQHLSPPIVPADREPDRPGRDRATLQSRMADRHTHEFRRHHEASAAVDSQPSGWPGGRRAGTATSVGTHVRRRLRPSGGEHSAVLDGASPRRPPGRDPATHGRARFEVAPRGDSRRAPARRRRVDTCRPRQPGPDDRQGPRREIRHGPPRDLDEWPRSARARRGIRSELCRRSASGLCG